MKTCSMILTGGLALTALSACGKKDNTVREEVKDKVGDALGTRPHEEIRDAAEDLEKDVKKAGASFGEALKEAGDAIKKEADKATE